MKVAIIGGGAIGLLLASQLLEKEMTVHCTVKREEQCQALRQEGLHLIREGKKKRYESNLTVSLEIPSDVTHIVVATKYNALPKLLPTLETFSRVPTLFIQNGIAHYALVQNSALHYPSFASVTHGATKITDTLVQQNGVGRAVIAKENATNWQPFVSETVVCSSKSAAAILYEKVWMNVLINPLTALYEVKNGELVQNRTLNTKMRALYNELRIAFPEIEHVVPFQRVEQLCIDTAENESSMYQDRKNNRIHEGETIVTPLIEEAKRKGVQLSQLIIYNEKLRQLNEANSYE